MNAPLIFLTVEVATIVCAALLILRVLFSRPTLPSAQLIALIAFGAACNVVLGHQEYGPWMPPAFRIEVGGWAGFLNLARNLTPGAIMLLCHTLFTDRRRFPRWLLVLLAVQLCLEEPGRWLIPKTWPYARFVAQTAPGLLQTLFVGFAFCWIATEWRGDLIEARRRARAMTLVVVGLVTLLSVLLTRVVIDPSSAANYAVHVALTAVELAVLASVLLRLTGGDVGRSLDFVFTPSAPRAPRPNLDTELGPSLARLSALLDDDRICEEEGLSLKGLADRVGLPEYRLRKLIHEELGYRNFNALLHHYRIREACRRLADPCQKRTPILTIALSVGYASVNTFSRGFREIMGVTPSAYREAMLAESGPQSVPSNGE